ncbi:nitroreductase family protein [Paucilactobacillus sp. N302-9]|jgi:predicted oxidoreductase (fatty acid repression mutant protein)
MKTNFLDLEKQRRTIYALGKNVTLSNDELTELIESAIKNAPTAFNNQTTRAIIAFGDAHDQVWDIVVKRLKSEVPDEKAYEATKAKIAGFKAAYATVLFFTDTDVVEDFKKLAPLYADNFGDWAEQGNGIANFATWTALADNGIGANLQHYNPIIDDQIRDAFDVPASWKLRAQMPFGSIEAPAGDKDFIDDSQRFKVLK